MSHKGLVHDGVTHEARATGDDGLRLTQPLADTLHQRATYRVAE